MATAKKTPAKEAAPDTKAAPAKKAATAKTTAPVKAAAPAKKVTTNASTKTAVPAEVAVPAKAAKKAIAASPATPAKVVAAAEPAPVAKRAVNAAFMKALTPSAALAAVIGKKPLPRTEVTKQLWVYIKKHGLQDSVNKKLINADAKLKEVFGQAQVDMFKMAGLIGKHLK